MTLPYATQRFAQLGWRVIRIESPGKPGMRTGDPNRYIGENTGSEDLHAYFIAPNIGKEAITIDLKQSQGQDLLKKLIQELKVDVFMCNTLPKRYKSLGIDYDNLKEANPELIWCGISAMGPDYPDFAGYDPALQAMTGYMHLTGEPDRDPMLCGLPIIDLKAGDEAFAQVILAMLEKEESGKGKEIHISMVQCAASWLITALPQLQFAKNKEEIFSRSGNEHRSFIPSNSYPTANGYVYMAIGSDIQWQKLIQIKGFELLNKQEWESNEGRKANRESIYAGIRAGLTNYTTEEFIHIARQQNLAVSPVYDTSQVAKLENLKGQMMKTLLADGQEVLLSPPAVGTDFLNKVNYSFNCAPHLGEHNYSILAEAGFDQEIIRKFENESII